MSLEPLVVVATIQIRMYLYTVSAELVATPRDDYVDDDDDDDDVRVFTTRPW